MTRCLVLGGSGFIGRHVVRALAECGVEQVVGDLVPNPEAPFVPVDFTDEESLQQALDGIDVVVHLAWTTVPQSATDNPSQDVIANVLGSLNLFRACIAQRVRRVVFCSTGGAIYGVPHYIPISETHPVAPVSSYGITKLTVEKYLTLFSRLYGLEHVILRPGNAYGEGQKNTKGQGVIAACLAAVQADQLFTVWGDGTVVRDYVHVSDIARVVSLAVTTGASNYLLNVGTGQGLSVNDLIALIKKVAQKPLKVRYVSQRLIDVLVNILDSSLAAEILGWKPQVSIQEGLLRQWRALQLLDTDSNS